MLKIKFLNRIFAWKELWALRSSFLRLFLRVFKLSVLTNLIKLYFSNLFRLSVIWGMPYLAMIESTSRCNVSCAMCGRSWGGFKRNERDMSFSEFRSAFDQIKSNLLGVGLWNVGEPFLNKDLCKIISYIHKEKVFSIVLTNGTLLDAQKSKEIIDSRLDYLGISIVGASAATYQKYRDSNDFEAVMANIKFLSEEKIRQKSLTPFIEIIFLVMRENEKEINTMVQLAQKLGVNKLSFKKIEVSFANKNHFISDLLPKNPKFLNKVYLGSKKKKLCNLPWAQVTINSNGDVVSCCSDCSDRKMGNIFVGNFTEIWNGMEFKKFRRKAKQNNDKTSPCKLICSEKSYDNDAFIPARL